MHVFELPSGVEVELREMTGAEEELLTNQRLIRTGDAVNQVLRNCIVRLGDNDEPVLKDVLDLLSGDRLFILVKLRQISLGNEVELVLTCTNPACRATNLVTIDIEELETTPYGEDREFDFTLPGSDRKVRFGYLDGHKEKRLAALKEPSISSAMLIRIIDIDGAAPSKKLMNDMSLRDRSALRQEMLRVDAGVDTTLEVDCESCGTRIRTRLEAEPGFLFPGVRL
ncbi:MAG: hypothetical protein SWH61_03800 [Thermodesulfobacteriota bacterium]|nr:hypothetical protein [Thermodesulfobacteriota bacterium]